MSNATNSNRPSPLWRLWARARALALATAGACLLVALTASGASAFGIESFDGAVKTASGEPATQAGSHPYEATTTIKFDTIPDPETTLPIPDGSFKDLQTLLPAGLIGDPTAVPQCTIEDFQAGEELLDMGECEDSSVVGLAKIETGVFGLLWAPVYNLMPEPDQPARFGFHILTASIYLNASVRTGGDYGLSFEIPNSSQALPVTQTTLTFWGVPAAASHDKERGNCIIIYGETGAECPAGIPAKPFLTNPTSCTGPVPTTLRANSWQEPAAWDESTFLSHDNSNEPIGADGCEKLPFDPSLEVKAEPGSAASPSSLAVRIHVPQAKGTQQLATAHLRKAVVTLPQGVAINAAAANGLGACAPSQIGLDDADPVSCPDSAKVGDVEIKSPLLRDTMTGAVYVAKQGDNPNGNLLTVYLVAEADGVLVKLPGKVDLDPASGQVTATFDENPQLPFEDLSVRFWGGPGGALVAPQSCGTYQASATLTPWSGTEPVTDSDSFAVSSGPEGGACPSGGFAPKVAAGTVSASAGKHSPFVLNVSREDGTQALAGIDAKLPKGLLAKLAGVPYCSDAELASIPTAAGTGAAQLAHPTCPAASRVGSVAVAAGAGSSPVFVDTGSVYLAGPYKGAPLSLAFVTPALAGPFDLGNVVVRAALKVDPETAQVEAVSDPIPTILAGIPLNLREIRVKIDRDRFMLNPTSCAETAVEVGASGAAGASATGLDRFQAASCASLGFAPKLALRLQGGMKRSAYPKLTATLTAKPRQANLSRVAVTMPHSEFLAQEHLGNICTRVQYAASECPKATIYGYAKAYTPLLDEPLEGPVYLRASSHPLPDLVAALRGQIAIDLAGRIDSVNGRIRTSFETIPDAPITKFVLAMKGGEKSLLVNSRDLCVAGPGKATIRIDGQNGKTADQRRAPRLSCGKGK